MGWHAQLTAPTKTPGSNETQLQALEIPLQRQIQVLRTVGIDTAAVATSVHHEVGEEWAREMISPDAMPLAFAVCSTSLRHSMRSPSGVIQIFPSGE
jgi:hypothetical protein